MRVLVVGEGPNEEAALPVFVQRLCEATVEMEFRKVSDPGFARIHGRGPGFFKRTLGWIRQAEREQFDALVFLIDQDGDNNRIRQIDDAQDDMTFQVDRACGVAIQTFDAWFLADEQALSQVLDQRVLRQPGPEVNRNPKADCDRLWSESTGVSFAGRSALYAALAKLANIEILNQRCPRGFKPFADRVVALNATD
ncbi:MAG: DUF4276 family protein [Rhodospirillales bacterium]|nr:DUF4276 family protein [Rhodospirillales bacterium]